MDGKTWLSPAVLRKGRRAGRVSSWDSTGRNSDWWTLEPGETRVLADLTGPGQITHIWFAQPSHYREVLIRITWDDAPQPSVFCPVGDFFGLGNGIANSYQSALFSASTARNHEIGYDRATGRPRGIGTALNCYAPMPFRKRAVIELINQSDEPHKKWFYIDYETFTDSGPLPGADLGYFHAEYRSARPFPGWGGDLAINTDEVDIPNLGRFAWEHNYVIAQTRGRGQYIGCNLSVANLCGGWWGEGDDMIWVDGYKWPPDLHGTGSEDYLSQAWGMQPNAHWRSGSSVYEGLADGGAKLGGYQTSYVFHLENPVYFERELKVTIEVGHGNHLRNDISSVGYWYAAEPTGVLAPPPVELRRPLLRDAHGVWQLDGRTMDPARIVLTREILDASPAVAEALRAVPPLQWTAVALPAETTLAELPARLADAAPLPLRSAEEVVGHVRLGISGDRLAILAEVKDATPRRAEPNFWEGTSFELFAATCADAQPGQVVLLPALNDHPDQVHRYRRACPLPDDDCPAIAWSFQPTDGGYRLFALVPRTAVALPDDCDPFRFDAAVNLPSPTGTARRATLSGTPHSAWKTARGMGEMGCCHP